MEIAWGLSVGLIFSPYRLRIRHLERLWACTSLPSLQIVAGFGDRNSATNTGLNSHGENPVVLYKVFEVQGLRSPAAVEAESSPMFSFFEVGLVACLVSGPWGRC